MSIKLMSLVWQDHTGNLSGIEKAVLLRMADFAADNGTQIFPSVTRIALDTGFSDKSIRRAINSLVEKKYISKTIRSRKTVHISNLYRINTATLSKAVNKPVDNPCIKEGGGVTQTPGVGSQRPEGGVTETRDPPSNHHIDPPPAKLPTNCIKNEQQEPKPQGQSKIPLADKKKITQDLRKLLKQTILT